MDPASCQSERELDLGGFLAPNVTYLKRTVRFYEVSRRVGMSSFVAALSGKYRYVQYVSLTYLNGKTRKVSH